METKQELVSHVKNWIEIDNAISTLQKNIKELKDQKKTLTQSLVSVMKENEIDCFDINDGKLIYSKSKYKKPINKKTLLDSLNNYFKDNNDLASDLSKFIMDNREDTIKENIRRKK